MRFWLANLGPDRLSDLAKAGHPLGVAWRQWSDGDERDAFVGQEIVRSIAFARALGPLKPFPTKTRSGLIRLDNHYFDNLIRRAILSEEEFDAAEFEGTVASAYKQVVRTEILALEPRDEPTPDFEVNMGRPVLIEAKARSRRTEQSKRVEQRVSFISGRLKPVFDKVVASIAIRITMTSEPGVRLAEEIVEAARPLIQAAVPSTLLIQGAEISVSNLDEPGTEHPGVLPQPYGNLPHVPPSVFAYLKEWSPFSQVPRGWGKTSYKAETKWDSGLVFTRAPRLLLIQVNVLPDNSLAIAALVHRARKQLPKRCPTAVFVRAAQFYSASEPFRMGQKLSAEMGNSSRIGGIVLWNQATKIEGAETPAWSQTLWWQLVAFRNPRAKHPLPANFMSRYLPNRDGFELMTPEPGPGVAVFGPRRTSGGS